MNEKIRRLRRAFFQDYLALLQKIGVQDSLVPGPALARCEPGVNSTSAIFAHQKIFSQIEEAFRPKRLSHEFRNVDDLSTPSYVQVTFEGWGRGSASVKRWIDIEMPGSALTVLSQNWNSGLVIAKSVARVDMSLPLDQQLPRTVEGILELDSLRRWILENEEVLKVWSGLCEVGWTQDES